MRNKSRLDRVCSFRKFKRDTVERPKSCRWLCRFNDCNGVNLSHIMLSTRHPSATLSVVRGSDVDFTEEVHAHRHMSKDHESGSTPTTLQLQTDFRG